MLYDTNLSPRIELDKQYCLKGIIGQHPKFLEILKLVVQVADTNATVLIYGESGTGKELISQALHNNSNRRDKPFVPLNCGAFQDTLLETELFGHVKGAFTGALKDKPGWFEFANDGTIFLDEIHDMSPALQLKLLRVSQTGEFSPVGSTAFSRSDVRIIAATNKDLKKLIGNGNFREELYYRLNVIDIRLPPLRERKSDIHLLIQHFLQVFGAKYAKKNLRLSPNVSEILSNYDYPGNIRELKNIMERCVVLTEGEVIEIYSLPSNVLIKKNMHSNKNHLSPFQKAKQVAIEKFEREYIAECLMLAKGNISRAARYAGIHVTNLHTKIQKYGIDPDIFKNSR